MDIQFQTKAAARRALGTTGVSCSNSKMPGTSYGITTDACHVGARLREVPGSVCHACYARRLENMRPSVRSGWTKAGEALTGMDREAWVAAVTMLVLTETARLGQPFHRWFDSGDLPNVEALSRIVEVCERTPEVRHWLPTRERDVVRDYLRRGGRIPENLVVRLSATMVDGESHPMTRLGIETTSTVHTKGRHTHGHECPASRQGNSCGDCRACWDRDVANVSYPKH